MPIAQNLCHLIQYFREFCQIFKSGHFLFSKKFINQKRSTKKSKNKSLYLFQLEEYYKKSRRISERVRVTLWLSCHGMPHIHICIYCYVLVSFIYPFSVTQRIVILNSCSNFEDESVLVWDGDSVRAGFIIFI